MFSHEIGADELAQNWSLNFDEIEFIWSKPIEAWLDYAVLLSFYKQSGRFSHKNAEISASIIDYLNSQIHKTEYKVAWDVSAGRTDRRRKSEIKNFLGIKPLSSKQLTTLSKWLTDKYRGTGLSIDGMIDAARLWCVHRKAESLTNTELQRLCRSVIKKFEVGLFKQILKYLPEKTKSRLALSLEGKAGVPDFADMKSDAGKVALKTVLSFTTKLEFIQSITLPSNTLHQVNPDWVKRMCRRTAQETAWEMLRRNEPVRLGMYTIYLLNRETEITDDLVGLLLETVHKIRKRAEKTVKSEVSRDVQTVYGKEKILADIAVAALASPHGRVEDVIFPIVNANMLQSIVDEQKARGQWAQRIYKIMRSSWASHYRQMLHPLLQTLKFRSNNAMYRPILEALEWMKHNTDNPARILRETDGLPVEGVVEPKWRNAVIEPNGDINRISYELCVLLALRDKLRCKEIWVEKALRYGNPDHDLPQDFDDKRDEYYQALGLGLDARSFTKMLKAKMTHELEMLNTELPISDTVRLLYRKNPRLSVSPLTPLPEPPQLETLKLEIGKRWPMTGLLEMLKEAALEIGFLDVFKTSGERVVLDSETLQNRLLLCLYGLGTNTGLKRMNSAVPKVSYKELLHVRRKFIDKNSLREAARIVANATLSIRNPAIWGKPGAACASDSKQFGAWDQNPLAEWHMRYGGRGIMIYWHVEKKSVCVYSQLKRVSSSETASMIQGVLSHCTDLEVKRQYTDSHGQSEVAFAFCHLLGFDLMPRLKAISRQKLCVPHARMKQSLGNIAPILSTVIDWKEIERHYDEMVKYTAAMKTKTADPETILRRFTRSGVMHPTYKALAELGRVIKTIFLCRYLRSEALRREIHEGLNVVENWNSATGFVHFGRGGEIATNRREDQEIAALSLHLLQNAMVYVNTHMYQAVLSETKWAERMTPEDFRGITPLIYAHINPYGQFDVNLGKRIDYARQAA